MSTHKMLKAVFAKVNRSGFHWLITPVLPRNRKTQTRFDAVGGLMVVSLTAGIILLVRFILAH